MKLFRLMATTAITAVSVAAMAVSASAALTATYTAPTGDAAGSVALEGIETTAEQKTLLILNNDATNVVEDDIVQIDQDATLTSVAVGDLAAAIDASNQTALDAYNAGEQNADTYATLTAAWKASTDYFVRVGGGDTIERYTLTVNTTKTLPEAPAEVPPEPELPLVGDIDNDQDWTVFDALEMLNFEAGEISMFDEYEYEDAITIGDIDADEDITVFDALEVLNYEAGEPSLLDDLIG